MRNFFLKILSISALVATLHAVDNINDIKPHSYGIQNITVGVTPGTYFVYDSNGNVTTDNFKTLEIEIHPKASLKQYHYKVGEWYWEGTGRFAVSKDNNDYEYQTFYGETDIGYATNFRESLLFAIDAGVAGSWTNITPPDDTDTLEVSEMYLYGDIFAGFDTRKFAAGVQYRHMIFNENGSFWNKFIISMPLQKNVDRDTAIIISPTYEYNEMTKNSVFKIKLSFSWLYR